MAAVLVATLGRGRRSFVNASIRAWSWRLVAVRRGDDRVGAGSGSWVTSDQRFDEAPRWLAAVFEIPDQLVDSAGYVVADLANASDRLALGVL
jgi:hypothetical protein